jgi:HdeA/HdeB family
VAPVTIHLKVLVCISIATAVLIVSPKGPIDAQTMIEMSKLKCKNYFEAPVDRREWFAAWMSGYFNSERNTPVVDFGTFASNKKKVERYCRGHKDENLMTAIRKIAA